RGAFARPGPSGAATGASGVCRGTLRRGGTGQPASPRYLAASGTSPAAGSAGRSRFAGRLPLARLAAGGRRRGSGSGPRPRRGRDAGPAFVGAPTARREPARLPRTTAPPTETAAPASLIFSGRPARKKVVRGA